MNFLMSRGEENDSATFKLTAASKINYDLLLFIVVLSHQMII